MKRSNATSSYWEETFERLKVELILLRKHWFVFVRCLFVLLYLASMLFRNLAYYRAVQGESLKDLGFELIPELGAPYKALSEVCIYLNHFVAALTLTIWPIFTKNPHTKGVGAVGMLLRLSNVLSVGHLLRFVSYISTSLPAPAEHCRLGSGEFDRPTEWTEIFFRFSSSADLNCGDLIFSGHQFQDMVFCCAIFQYASLVFTKRRYAQVAKVLMVISVVAQFVLIIGARNHYTVDVVVSSYLAPLLWISYGALFPEIAMPQPSSSSSHLDHSSSTDDEDSGCSRNENNSADNNV